MRLRNVRPTLGASAVFVVFAAALALLGGGGTPASAAQNIASSSCGGVGYPNCLNLPANVTIGANSCTVLGACDDLGNGTVIGAGSCIGTDACDYAGGAESGLTGFARIGNGSCIGNTSCEDVGYGDTGSGSAWIGDNACTGDESACRFVGYSYRSGVSANIGTGSCHGRYACSSYDGLLVVGVSSCRGYQACTSAGFEGEARIGDGSCNEAATADEPCYELGYYGKGEVGDASCLGYRACYQVAYYGTADIGENSCVGSEYACAYAGYSNTDDPDYPGQSATATIGGGSCHGYYACYMYYGHQTIGDDSCNGEYACNYLGTSDFVTPNYDLALDTATVGDNSCNGDGACDSGSDGGSGSVGDSSCNQDGQYDARCNGADVNVGDCLYNDLPLCVVETGEATVTVTKVFTDHSAHTVQVRLECPEADSVDVHGTQTRGDGDSVTYDIEFTGESVRCTVSESGVAGYLPTTSCSGDATVRRSSLSFDLGDSGAVHCTFTNSPTEEQTSSGGGGGKGSGNNGSGASTCNNGLLTGTRPPAGGGFGTFAFCGGTFPALLAASGCPQATAVFFYNKPDGSFASWIPAAEVAAANEAIQALFASTIPAGTIFTARCV